MIRTIVSPDERAPPETQVGWVELVAPTPAEIERLTSDHGIAAELIHHSLDLDERPRVLIDNEVRLVVLQVPFANAEPFAALPYETVPLGIFFAGEWVVTVSPRDSEVLAALRHFAERDWPRRKHPRFLLRAMEVTAETYLVHLYRINRAVDAIEERLATSLQNREVLELLKYQKSLIYYGTALRACERLLERLQQTPLWRAPAEDEELLADVLVEIRQAIDVATVSGNILGEMMNAFASIISNNLNAVMKFLAAVTIVLTLPVAIASFYGMNVGLPGQHSTSAFAGLIAVSVALSLLVAVVFRRRGWL